MVGWRLTLLVTLMSLVLGAGSACGSQEEGNSNAIVAILIARAMGITVTGAGAQCPNGGQDCPAATEGGLTAFDGQTQFAPSANAIRVSGHSCNDCLIAVYSAGTGPDDPLAAPIATGQAGAGAAVLIPVDGPANGTGLSVYTRPDEATAWIHEPQAVATYQ